jgi:diaminopimelate decarboxylase
MNDMPRVAMYGIQEPLFIFPQNLSQLSPTRRDETTKEYEDYVVVGHCCESSDIITAKLYDSEMIEPRSLSKASI